MPDRTVADWIAEGLETMALHCSCGHYATVKLADGYGRMKADMESLMRRFMAEILAAAASFGALAASDDGTRLTETYTPLSVEKCVKSDCRSVRFGLEDGQLIVKGDLTPDEAKAIIASMSCEPGIADELPAAEYLSAWVRHAALHNRAKARDVGELSFGAEFTLKIVDPSKPPTLAPQMSCRGKSV